MNSDSLYGGAVPVDDVLKASGQFSERYCRLFAQTAGMDLHQCVSVCAVVCI